MSGIQSKQRSLQEARRNSVAGAAATARLLGLRNHGHGLHRYRRVASVGDGVAQVLRIGFGRFHHDEMLSQVDGDLRILVGRLDGLGSGAGAVPAGRQALTETLAGKPVSVSSSRLYGCAIKYKG